MRRNLARSFVMVAAGIVVAAVLVGTVRAGSDPVVTGRILVTPQDISRVQRGFEIAPVPLDVAGKNRGMVGLGSYLVNAVGGCNDCHSCPSYAPGHNPYAGGDGKINATNYLAGGVHFGPFVSANITPDENGLPEGFTAAQFIQTIRTGHPADHPDETLFVMPWPIYRNMSDSDLLAIYTYLTAIPHAEPGECSGAGE